MPPAHSNIPWRVLLKRSLRTSKNVAQRPEGRAVIRYRESREEPIAAVTRCEAEFLWRTSLVTNRPTEREGDRRL